MIDVLCWCSSRELFVTGMSTTYLPDGRTLATVDEQGNLAPAEGVTIDEIGPITKTPATYDEEGNELTPAVIVGGHHVNLRASGAIAEMLTQGLPQTDAEGNPLGLFERTHLLSLIPGLEWVPITEEGVPEGYQGPNGVRLFDPAVVNNRRRVWL